MILLRGDAPRFFDECINKFNGQSCYMAWSTYEDRYTSDNFEYWCLYKEKLSGLSKYVIPKSKWDCLYNRFPGSEKILGELVKSFIRQCF